MSKASVLGSSTSDPHLLGTGDIKKLLLQYSLPAITGMIVTALYHIIDSIFVGHGIGSLAISAMAATFPIMNIMAAFSTLIGVGGATLTSIRLGKKDEEGAASILGHVALLNTINSVILSGVTIIFLDPILRMFGASDALLPYARDFMEVILIGYPISFVFLGLNNIMRVSGYPKKAMQSSFLTVAINVVLAPLFIFGFKWGMRGTALATVISQFAGLVWVMSHFLNKNNYIHFTKGFKFSFSTVKQMLAIGLSPFLMNMASSLVVSIINLSLTRYGGDLAIGAYGIINRILTLFLMIVVGITMGMQPVAGYNYGAKKMNRAFSVLKYSLIGGVTVTTIGFLLSELFPRTIVSMFTTDQELIDISVKGLRLSFAMFPLVGAQVVISNFFQTVGKPKISIFLSLTRQLIFLIPFLFILPKYFGLAGVFSSIPSADLIAFIISTSTLFYQFNKVKKEYNFNGKAKI
ncbi:MAG: MATE family efflux transporter [Dysgonamonadaceae bacterium]|jgi:putative MATE family efflux protein|nr:MATE family efflux transporter [Dysgonamonadaceae bacterium]MDD3308931.1 MATE family efflux transporter [Dysgonamonadaceae bacterium]MDD3900214.1 MATE family efflux transporter [Dysgonamonadaceae bacterium]MDD4398497.1 MATE family efflux transporter [Dysgonamonadaceae bacterium]MEA5081216.1 MATE family efflux transporter [Dysgonamonadaceae bacterium]